VSEREKERAVKGATDNLGLAGSQSEKYFDPAAGIL